MYESISNEMNNKLGMANLQGQNKLNKTQQMMNGVSALGDAVTKGMSVYAQSTWNKDKYDLRQKLIAGQEEFLNVDNENASNDYAAWADKQMEDYVSQKSPMIRGLLNEQKQEFIDDARTSFDTQLINRIDARNKLNSLETWDKAIQAFTENPDGMDLFEMKDVYSTTVGNDGIKVTHEKVKIDNLFDTESDGLTDKQKNFNKLLNVLYESRCLVTDQDAAKAYVESKIPDIEESLIKNDIAMLAGAMINDGSFKSEKAIVDNIASDYLAGFSKPFTGDKITDAESFAYRKMASEYVGQVWAQAEAEAGIKYNENVLPALIDIEANGGYVTTEIFNNAVSSAGIDSRFVDGIKAKWNNVIMKNDAMYALEDWFNNGNPMSNTLSDYAKDFVYEATPGEWKYTGSAGFATSSGNVIKYVQSQRNIETDKRIEAKGKALESEWEKLSYDLIEFGTVYQREDNEVQKLIDHTVTDDMTEEEKIIARNSAIEEIRNKRNTLQAKMDESGYDYSDKNSQISVRKSSVSSTEADLAALEEKRAKEEKERQRVNLVNYDMELDDEAGLFVASHVEYQRGTKANPGANYNMALTCGVLEDIAEQNGIKLDFSNMSYDPLGKGLTQEQIDEAKAYADKNDMNYLQAYMALYCDEQGRYDVMYQMQGLMLQQMNPDLKPDEIALTITSYNTDVRDNVWKPSFDARCENYEHELAVYNGKEERIETESGVSYAPVDPSSYGSGSSSSQKTSETRLEAKQKELDDAVKAAEVPSVETPGVFEGYLDLLFYGSNPSDISFCALNDPLLTQEQREKLNTMVSSDMAKEAFGALDRYGIIKQLDKMFPVNGVDRTRAVMSLVDRFVSDYDSAAHNEDRILSNWLSDYQQTGYNVLFNAIKTYGKTMQDEFYDNDNTFSDSFISILNDFGSARVGTDKYHSVAELYQTTEYVDNYVNQGVTNDAGIEGLSIFAGKNTEISDDELMKNCVIEACRITGNAGLVNGMTDLQARLGEWQKELFDSDGNPRYTDPDAQELANTLLNVAMIAGELADTAKVMKYVSMQNLNLGTVVSVNGDRITMSSGVTVGYTGKDREGNPLLYVLPKENTVAPKIKVEEFASDGVLEKITSKVRETIMDDDYYNQQAAVYNGYHGAYINATDNNQVSQIKWDAFYNMLARGRELTEEINWNDFGILKDGQFSEDWCNLYGYNAPELYTGYSINGLNYNWRITTNPNQKYENTLPESFVTGAVKGAMKTATGEVPENYEPYNLPPAGMFIPQSPVLGGNR